MFPLITKMEYAPYNVGFHSGHRLVYISLDLGLFGQGSNWVPNKRILNTKNAKKVTNYLKELRNIFKSQNIFLGRDALTDKSP